MSAGVAGPLYRAWRLDQIPAGPAFPEAWYGAADLGEYAESVGHTLYVVLGAAAGWPVATVAYHGRTGTWCCGCPVGIAGRAPCRHVVGVAWWVELAQRRAGFEALPDHELIELWARAARRVVAYQGALTVVPPPNWRLGAAALFGALVRRGLAVERQDDPVWDLVDQAPQRAARSDAA